MAVARGWASQTFHPTEAPVAQPSMTAEPGGGLVAAIRRRLARHAGLALAGNAFDGVGIPDCIRSGQEAADATLAALAEAARTAAA